MRLVRESILFEKFIEDSDPITDMGIGMIHQIKKWLKDRKNVEIRGKYRINKDLTISVQGDLVISHKPFLVKLPEYIQFRTVSGICWFNDNPKLTTLKGGPMYVKRWFCCNNNKLTSLEYAPKKVGNDFFCGQNAKGFVKKDVLKVCEVKGKIVTV